MTRQADFMERYFKVIVLCCVLLEHLEHVGNRLKTEHAALRENAIQLQ